MKRLLSSIRLGLAIACIASAAQAPRAFAGGNLLANPDFEAGGGSYTGYFTFGSGVQLSTPATDNIFLNGTTAAKIYGGFAGCPGTGSFSVCGFGQTFTPTVGKIYEFTGNAFVSTADKMLGSVTCNSNRVLAKIAFFNAASGGTEIQSNEVVIADGNLPRDQWVPFSVSAPAPTGALRVEADILYLQPGCDTGSAFVDGLSFTATSPSSEPNLLVNPSFASPLATGWTTFGNVLREVRSLGYRTLPGGVKMFSTFVAGSPSGMYQRFTTTPGTQWRLRASALNTCQDSPLNPGNDNFVTEKIVFRDAANVELGNSEEIIADASSKMGTWKDHAITGTAPAGTAAVEAYILFNSPSLLGGAIFIDDVLLQRADLAGVDPSPRASALEMGPAQPNPFHGATQLDFTLTHDEIVDAGVFDVVGRRVATLASARFAPGTHSLHWDGRTSDGSLAAAGVYRAVLRTASGRVSRSLVLTH